MRIKNQFYKNMTIIYMPAIRKTRKKKLINKTQKKGEINYNSSNSDRIRFRYILPDPSIIRIK